MNIVRNIEGKQEDLLDLITALLKFNCFSSMSDPKKKKRKKIIGFEPISSKFGTLEAEKITLFPVIIFQLFSSYPPLGRVL